MKWFCCLSVPGAVLFIMWPRLLICTLLGEKFISAESALQWFGVAFVPMFVSLLSPFICTALRLPGVFCLAMALAVLVRVGADNRLRKETVVAIGSPRNAPSAMENQAFAHLHSIQLGSTLDEGVEEGG